ncbi:MAG: signal peptidase II [Planctomycetota bacterium]
MNNTPEAPQQEPKEKQPETLEEISLERPHAGRLFLMILGVILAADLLTKYACFQFLGVSIFTAPDGTAAITASAAYPIFPGLALEAALNLGAFNGWFAGMRWFLIAISALAIPICLCIALMSPQRPATMVWALALIASGALGNLYDRIVYGGVRDFIRCSIQLGDKEWVWPNFNIADSAIVCGVALILLREWTLARRARGATAE